MLFSSSAAGFQSAAGQQVDSNEKKNSQSDLMFAVFGRFVICWTENGLEQKGTSV